MNAVSDVRIHGRRTKIPLPPMKLRLMQDSDEAFVSGAAEQAGRLRALGFGPDDRLLDIGCSVGRTAIGVASTMPFTGTYTGFDIQPELVGWAHSTLEPRLPGFTFTHLDVYNGRYNPRGAISGADVTLPVSDASFDYACLFSVFTHMYRADIEHYLSELGRALAPGGTVLATWFIYCEDRVAEAVESTLLPMPHRLDETTIFNNTEDPLYAIAYGEAQVRSLVARSGFELIRIEPGHWRGGSHWQFQDAVILRKPGRRPWRRSGEVLVRRGRRLADRAAHGVRWRVRRALARRRAARP